MYYNIYYNSLFHIFYKLYLKNYSSECKIIKTDKNGFLAEIYKTGEATVINNSDVDKILKDFSAETVFYEEVGDITEIYAFSKKIRYKKSVGGKIVNLHIIKNKTTIKVGSPIIFGSF